MLIPPSTRSRSRIQAGSVATERASLGEIAFRSPMIDRPARARWVGGDGRAAGRPRSPRRRSPASRQPGAQMDAEQPDPPRGRSTSANVWPVGRRCHRLADAGDPREDGDRAARAGRSRPRHRSTGRATRRRVGSVASWRTVTSGVERLAAPRRSPPDEASRPCGCCSVAILRLTTARGGRRTAAAGRPPGGRGTSRPSPGCSTAGG